jgi:hypothetical protein
MNLRTIVALIFLINLVIIIANIGTLPIKQLNELSDMERTMLLWNILVSFCSFLLAIWIYHDKEEIEELKKHYNEKMKITQNETKEGTEKKNRKELGLDEEE